MHFCTLIISILYFCLCKVVFYKTRYWLDPSSSYHKSNFAFICTSVVGNEEALLIVVLMFISGIHFWIEKLLCQRSARSELYDRVINSENRRLSNSRWSGNRFLTLSESFAHSSVLFPCNINLSYLKAFPMKENHRIVLFVKQLCPETR